MSAYEDPNSYESNTNYKAIACEQIPEIFLDKIVAKKHFSKFGKIKRFILRPNRLCCTVEYENEEDAKSALLNAGSFNGLDFNVSYAEQEEAHVQNTEEWVDPEVQAELEAMSPGQRMDLTLRSVPQKSTLMNRPPPKLASNLLFAPKQVSKVFAVNRQNSPQKEISKIDAVVRQELEAILKTPAFTEEEKYRVLDARDKLLRLSTVRQTDIKKAVATKGTCPDMCPEKERLMREFQRQVSIFEMAEEETSESKISHKKAIKEYSRSSADQEVPLPHELRSESVLQMTMLYLAHRIVGLCDDPKTSLGDWFHFVWDRTRSIRKDITQQELCSLGAVQLVEQCARFHIHCAARLVAEDPSVFDKKINAENLTKCLQTLKYMYHDLRIKGVDCPCETEFRSYVILLNLGDSNFLWELKHLPEFIQKSYEIKRAVAFYNALQNNNYVKFFSMVKSYETSYLSACILLGYFTKLRVRAMDAIVKSHNWRKNDVYLPLTYLTNVLGFDDESSAVNFFNHYSLHCDIVDKRVLLERLIQPNIEYAMDRALQLVESKRLVSVGECVFGQTLPSAALFEQHQPQNSFDDNGMFKMELLSSEDRSMEIISKAQTPLKTSEKHPDKNSSTVNDTNLFKMPQAVSEFSPKQQRKQTVLAEEKNEPKGNLLDLLNVKAEEKNVFQNQIKLQSNIFSGNVATRPTNDSIFKAAVFNTKPEENQKPSFFNSLFKPFSEKPSPSTGNIFGVLPSIEKAEGGNIFSIAVKETANVFQQKQDVPIDNFFKENTLQQPQINKETPLFALPKNEATFAAATKGIVQNNEVGGSAREKAENKLQQIKNEMKKLEELKKLREQELLELEKLKKLRQQKLLEEQQKKEMEKLKKYIEEKAAQTTEDLVSNFIEEEVGKVAQTELLISLTIEQSSDLEKEELLEETVKVLVHDIANEEYGVMCHDQLLLNRYFTKWLMHLRKKKEQRKLIENTPLWVSSDTRAEFAQSIKHPGQQKNMELIKRYRMGQPCDLTKLFRSATGTFPENSLNFFALIGQHLLTKRNFTSCGMLQQRNYFKILITLPRDEEELLGFESFSNKLLSRLIESSKTDTSSPFVLGMEHNIALCVRKLNGITPKNEQGITMTTEANHNDGIICFITGVDIETQSRKRLHKLLKLSRNFKRVPLAIIAYNCYCNNEELSNLLDLDSLLEEELIYSYIILGSNIKRKDFNFRKSLIEAVDFITTESYSMNSNEVQALAMQNVLNFLESSLGEEIWQRWWHSAQTNPIFNKICSFPEHVLGIYHKALDHLLHITQEDLDEMPEFPEELKQFVPDDSCFNVPLGLEFFPLNWKDKSAKNAIKQFLQSLYLPKIDEQVPNNVEDLKMWLVKYISKLFNDDDFAAAKASYEAITNLVQQINGQSIQTNNELCTSLGMINYLNIFKPIIYAHTNEILKRLRKELQNLKIIYLKDDLKNYQTQPWWLNYESLNLVKVDHNEVGSNRSSQEQRVENKQTLNIENDIDKIIAKAEETVCKVEQTFSEYKKRKHQTDFINSPTTTQVKRSLENSLYHFELFKQVGEYDTSIATDLTQDIDKSISKVLNKSLISKQKRKMSCLKSSNLDSDVESVIAKATKLIHSIESVDDKKYKKNFTTTDRVKM